jgi:lactate dehydrogenase-like 2-hydroxyacid dehydrogenase
VRAELLVVVTMGDELLDRVREEFEIHHAPWADLATYERLGRRIRGVWTNGTIGITAAAIEALPKLQIIVAQGAGTENIDMAAARRRGIVVTNGAGTNPGCVADHAMALLLTLVREIPNADRLVRKGEWASLRTDRPTIYGKRLGIAGLGRIGSMIARRASGFDLSIAYHGRRPVEGAPYEFVADIVELAARSDFLVLSCPGGPATYHMANAAVLRALGPCGYIVNVARGSVIDTQALVDALGQKAIAGAALDVFENEPGVPQALWSLPNVVLTPHLAGAAPQVRRDQVELALRNLKAFFAGGPLVNVLLRPDRPGAAG